MGGAEIGFVIWAIVGLAIVCMGIRALFSGKAVDGIPVEGENDGC